MILLYVTLFRTLNTILENKSRSNAHIGTFKTNGDVMRHTEHEVWEGDESPVAVFTASCPHARSARFSENSLFICMPLPVHDNHIKNGAQNTVQTKLPYSSVLYPGSYLTLVTAPLDNRPSQL